MTFSRYSEYKDSGVAWLGEVPGHWGAIRYKNVFVEKSNVVGASLPSGSISFGRVVFKDDEFLHESTKASYQEVLSGEFLINPINLNYDLKSLRTALSEIDTCVSPAYIVLKAVTASDKGYLKYQLHVFDLFHMKTLGAGVRQTITFSDIGGCFTVLPPLLEQSKISAFLDRETGKIDALIAEQQRLVELLAEKRQAVISHAVTKGLNPNASMKDSGIEWLGEVPEHWEVKRLKNISPQITVGIVVEPSKYYCEHGIPALRSLNIQPGKITLENLVYISESANDLLAKSKLNAGDLVAVRSGQPGITAVIPDELDGCNCIDLIIIRRPQAGCEKYLCWYLSSDVALHQFAEGSGGAIQQHFNIGTAMNLVIATPPLDEQKKIAAFINDESAKFDTLTVEANRAIELLQERRSALISAAVTGKIDVRSFNERKAA